MDFWGDKEYLTITQAGNTMEIKFERTLNYTFWLFWILTP